MHQAANSAEETAAALAAFKQMLLPQAPVRAGAITYEQIAEGLRGNGEPTLADWLDEWIQTGLQADRNARPA